MNAPCRLATTRSERKGLSVQSARLARGRCKVLTDEWANFSQTFRALCLTVQILLVSLPSTDSQSDQTRCAQGYWWGPDAAGGNNLVIAARYDEDVSWLVTHLQGVVPFVVYNTKDSTATHYTPVHNGNEAAAYVQFIVDYFDCLPDYMAFIHAHRRDMKVAPDFDMDSDLKLVDWSSTLGFASLNRSNLLWHIILNQHRRKQRHSQQEHQQEQTEYHVQAARAIRIAWDQVFGAQLGPLPSEVLVNGGGQFMVQRNRVLAHPRAFYQQCLTWLASSTDLSPWDKGMVFEYTWKTMFGDQPEHLDHNIWE